MPNGVDMKIRLLKFFALGILTPAVLLAQPVQKKTIVGVWEVKLSLADESQSPQLSVAMFGNDGSFTAAGGNKALPPIPALQAVANELGPAFGRWAPTGTREFSLTSHAVMAKAGLGDGFQRVHYTLVLSESGEEYTGHAEVDFLDADWNVVFSTTGDVKATRLKTPATVLAELPANKQLLGLWEENASPVGQSDSRFLSLAMFGRDGCFTTAGGYKALPPVLAVEDVATELGPGYGQWAATDNAGEFRLAYYSVLWKAGLVNGFQRVQCTLALSESGGEYTGHAQVDFLNTNWKIVFSTTREVKGTRLEIPAGLVARPAEKNGVWEVKFQRLGVGAPPPVLGLILFCEDGSFSADVPRHPAPIPAIQAVGNELGPIYGRVVQTDGAYRTVFYLYSVVWKAGLVNGFTRTLSNQVLSESDNEWARRAQVDYFDASWTVVFSMTGEMKATRLETPGRD
jgi:hypothetical protein